MDIKYLPEITEPQNNDWLVIQRGDLTGKIKYSNLNLQLPIDPIPNPTEDEDNMYMGMNPPDNLTPGKIWGEVDGAEALIQTWIWQKHPLLNDYTWMSDNKTIAFPELQNESKAKIEIDIRFDYLIKYLQVSYNSLRDCSFNLYCNDYYRIFLEESKIANLQLPSNALYYTNVKNLLLPINTVFSSDVIQYKNLLGIEMIRTNTNEDFLATAVVGYQLVKK